MHQKRDKIKNIAKKRFWGKISEPAKNPPALKLEELRTSEHLNLKNFKNPQGW